MDYFQRIETLAKEGEIPKEIAQNMQHFCTCYENAIKAGDNPPNSIVPILNKLLDLIVEEIKNPYQFEPFHRKITQPFDYYKFGNDLIRPLVDIKISKVLGLPVLDTILTKITKGENVIFFANHQIEADPQAISILLEKSHPLIGSDMIYVAGHRVTTDPLAIPGSKGRNLLCIYSKRHIEHPPEMKKEKLQHNHQAMNKLELLLSEGGKCIYVAPSGGRDRCNDQGIVEIAPFDPQNIEVFWLRAQRSKKPTHFYPMALATYEILPPPKDIKSELGEIRTAKRAPIHLAVGKEINMETFPGSDVKDKNLIRENRSSHIWELVKKEYEKLTSNSTFCMV